MLVVFFGSDRKKVRDGATSFIDAKMPEDAQLTTIESADFTIGQVADELGATSLFGGSEWYVFDTPSDSVEFDEEVKKSLAEMKESRNTFVILEGVLLAPAKKAYGKYADNVTEFMASQVERFNAFALAEALAKKDKRRLWLLLQEARLNGLRDEEIVGILWWQLKALRLAANTKSALEAGMKEFPYNKAKQALRTFKTEEVVALSHSLLELYHAGHGGVRDMDTALEQWVLELS